MTTSSRVQFARTATDLVESDLSVALVYAEISGQFFGDVERRHPDRVVNVGIREQLLVNVGAGMALTGLRPIVHTFGSFLVERAFEQVKLGFGHQDVGGVLVGAGGSFDIASGGRTHQVPGDVALVDTLPGVSIHAPGTAQEVDAILRATVAGSGLHYVRVVEQANAETFAHAPGGFHVVRRGAGATVIALGPVLDAVLAATEGLDVTVLYSATVRPFDGRGSPVGAGLPGGRARRAVAGRDVGPRGRRRAARRTPPAARPGGRPHRAAPLRDRGRPRPGARARRCRHPSLARRVPGRGRLSLPGSCA